MSAAYVHSCLKMPVQPRKRPKGPAERNFCAKGRRSATPTQSESFHSVASYLEFYSNIPDYSDLNDLSENEFYAKLNEIKATQKNFRSASSLLSHVESPVDHVERPSSESSMSSKLVSKNIDGSRRKFLDVSVVSPQFDVPERKHSAMKPKIVLRKDFEEQRVKRKSPDLDSCLLDGIEAQGGSDTPPYLHHHHPHPSMCHSMSALSLHSPEMHLHRNHPRSKSRSKIEKSHEVPLLSKIPLFDKIMAEQEERRRINHERYSKELQALVQPFSFTKREEEKQAFQHSRSCSSSDLHCHRRPPCSPFRARPVPRNLFSDDAYERMREDQFYRALRKRIRADEMLKNAALPPSMEARESFLKAKSESPNCLDGKANRRRRSRSRSKDYRNEQENIARDVQFSKCRKSGKSAWLGNKGRPSSTTDSSADCSPNASTIEPRPSRRPHSALSVSRSNLASVLRIQTSRKRLEEAMKTRLADQELEEHAKFKARLLRLSPAWRQLDYNTEEDLALRLAQRRQEAKERGFRHRKLMEKIYGRVHDIPPLFQEPGRLHHCHEPGSKNAKAKSLESNLEQMGKDNSNNDYASRKAMMPSVVPIREKTEAEWQALKKYIIRDRQKKKQEQEADEEVERQRREREQKEKQDVMTLGEVKEQITELEGKLASLTEEKHQLFLTLKKVLNEDDNRRRQAVKETGSELIGVGANYANIGTPVFLQPLQSRTPLYKVGATPSNAPGPSGNKRLRSPSPPTAQGPPGYHSYNNYKSPSFQHKPEDGRRSHEYVRAVLWNKGTTYGGVYGVAPSQPVYSYSTTPGATYEQVYLPRQSYDGKSEPPEKVYLRGPAGPLPMPVHPQSAKAGGISSGFPVRASHQPHSVYITQGSGSSRLLYGTAPTSVPTARYQSSGAL